MKFIVESIVGFIFALWFIAYYTGKLNYSGRKEDDRKSKVEKHGNIIILIIVLTVLFSLVLLLTGLAGIGVI